MYLFAQSMERGYNSQGTSQLGFTTKECKTSKVQHKRVYILKKLKNCENNEKYMIITSICSYSIHI